MKQRLLTALALLPLVLLVVWFRTPWPLAALGLVATGIGAAEYSRLISASPVVCIAIGSAGYTALIFAKFSQSAPMLSILVLAGLAVGIVSSLSIPAIATGGALWISSGLASIVLLHHLPGRLPSELFVFIPVWSVDIAAMLIGRKFGKKKLAPKVSPGKTAVGAMGGLAAGCVAGAAIGWVAHSPLLGFAAGFAAGTFGQIGDLFESWLKRNAGMKDSGSLIPGHGGLLDRIDSLLMAAPVICAMLLR